MVAITAKVFLNFNLDFKNRTIGLPINEITPAIDIYISTSLILYRKSNKIQIPNIIAKALNIPLLMFFESVVFNTFCVNDYVELKFKNRDLFGIT